MAEACGSCYSSFLPSRKTNESLKCVCQRPFFSQTVSRNNLPTDRDCWIEVPKRFVRHYSSLFGETVKLEGDDGRSHRCLLVGSDIAIVGYGFEWYDFASSHNVGMGDQVVFTLMEKSRFLVLVHRAKPQTVKVEQDVDLQVAAAQDWLLAKARRSGTTTSQGDLGADVDTIPPLEAIDREAPERNEEIDGKIPSSKVVYVRRNAEVREGSNRDVAHTPKKTVKSTTTDGEAVESESQSEDTGSEDADSSSPSTSDTDWKLRGSKREMYDSRKGSGPNESDSETTEATSLSNDSMTEEELKRNSFPSRPGSRSRSRGKTSEGSVTEQMQGGDVGKSGRTRPPYLYVAPRRDFAHHWAEPGTTRRKTYVSKRGPVTCAERERAFEAAKACPITHNSYLRQLEKDNCYRALILAIPAPWCRENMPQTNNSYMGTLVDEEGNSWQSRIRGTEIFWGNFTLDHYLEEDDVVVMELVDRRLKSLKFLVHIFRVVNVRMTVTGKAGWAVHYSIVEGIKTKQACRQRLKAQGKERLKRKHDSKVSNPSHKRLTRREAALQSFEEIVDSEHNSEDSLPLEFERDFSDRGPTLSKTDCQSKFGEVLRREVKIEMMEHARDSNDGGPIPSITDSYSKYVKTLPRKVKTEFLN